MEHGDMKAGQLLSESATASSCDTRLARCWLPASRYSGLVRATAPESRQRRLLVKMSSSRTAADGRCGLGCCLGGIHSESA